MSEITTGAALIAAIQSGDAPASLAAVGKLVEGMRTPADGANYVMWISEPVNLTSVHKALVEHLGIAPRLLAIRRQPNMNRTQRAMLLVSAMESAIKRVHTL